MKIVGIGLLIFLIGVVADTYWHAQLGDEGTREIVFAHLPLSIGIGIIAYGAWLKSKESVDIQAKILMVLTVLASGALVARITDDIFHIMDQHDTVYNTVAHTVWGIGFLGMLLLLIAAAVVPKWLDVSSGQAKHSNS